MVVAGATKDRQLGASHRTRHALSPRDRLQLGLYHLFAWTARVLILALVALVPWIYGGVQWQVQQVIVWTAAILGIVTLLAAAFSPRSIHTAHLTYFMAALLAIGLLQTVPVPSWSAAWMSSSAFIADVHQLASSSASPASPTAAQADAAAHQLFSQALPPTVSICSARSRAALAVMAAATLVVLACSLLFGSRRWAQVLVVTICASGFANACLGLMQRVAWNGWSWLDFPAPTFYSTFVSRNSACDFFASACAGLVILLGLAYKSRKKERRQTYRMTYPSASFGGRIRNRMEDLFIDLDTWGVVCLCAIALMMVSVLATYSRGGMVSILGAAIVTIGLTLGGRDNAWKAITVAGSLIVVAVLLLGMFSLDDDVLKRLDELNQSVYETDGRFTVWSYTLSAISWYWLWGSGLCTYQFAILPFHDGPPSVWFQHAENLYLEACVELGLPGLLCVLGALATIVRDLFWESRTRRENLLHPGVVFLLFALAIHSLVDFSLILPGVFLPAAALIGAFGGRLHRARIEHAHARAQTTIDARLTYGKPAERAHSSSRSWHRLIVPTCVVMVCLLTQWRGAIDLDGLAHAERLQRQLEKLEELAATEPVPTTDLQQLTVQSANLVQAYTNNPEVHLIAGRIDLLALRCQLAAMTELQAIEPYSSRWQFTHPQSILTFLSVTASDPELKSLQDMLAGSSPRHQLLSSSVEHFRSTLHACPFDSRAAWGLYLSGLGLISDQDERMTSALLMILSRSNPSILFKAGVAAIAASTENSPRRQLGLQMFALAIELDQVMIDRGLPTMLGYLPSDQIIALVPRNVVLRAKTARLAFGISARGQEVARALVQQIAPELKAARAVDSNGWSALAWAAIQSGDKPLAIGLLRRTQISGEDTTPVRLLLAQTLFENGQVDEARQELKVLTAKDPTSEAAANSLREKWSQSVDPRQ